MAEQYQAYIGGRFIDGETGETLPSINPASEEEFARFPVCSVNDVNRAVRSAREAFVNCWRRTSCDNRATVLNQIAEGIRAHATELAELETADSGKLLKDNLGGDIPEAANCFEYFAKAATELKGRSCQVPFGNFSDRTVREPVGVVASIAAWNYPLVNAAWKIAPAIAAGNCVVYKPAEDTSLSTLLLARIIDETDAPKGLINIVTGPGATTGAALTAHPGVDKISFTGSTGTGKRVMYAAAENITGVALELGGKSPNIVFDDCDLDKAIAGAMFGIFVNAGQVCTAGSRLLVQEGIYEAFLDRLQSAAESIRVGDPRNPESQMGPLVNRAHFDRVTRFVEQAKRDGARLRTGGGRPPGLKRGFYFAPTIFEQVEPGSQLDQEEVFGPVVAVIPFRSEDDAVEIANATRFGLAAGIWTRDSSRAERIAAELDAGTVWINTYNIATASVPFAGFKSSGIGVELGDEGLAEYTRLKNICIDLGDDPIDYFT
jgi:acyl-CoA reductase-like NAD-dependent aldehyde dehydrogenase